MAYSLLWLPDVLKSAGLKVALVEGWENRGRGEVGQIFGVMCHHTAGSRSGNMPSLKILIEGRANLSGPLSQLGLGRDGTFYVIAAGRCNHAGTGIWKGLVNGNFNFIGIEAENTGGADDLPWPAVQMDAYRRGVAAILQHIGQPADYCCGHKEYALPKGRKPDVSFDMLQFRTAVSHTLNGSLPLVSWIPSKELTTQPNGAEGRLTIRRGMKGELVKVLQHKLQLQTDGIFGPKTEAALRVLQRRSGLVPDGIVGPKTWKILDSI